jgi:NADPH-dependent 2,4-dienoyl-CoA reductase/sulfur reductase-like enzyme
MHYDHLIIGGGIAGMSAAQAIRVRDGHCSIAVFGNEPHPVYSRVLLPHVVRGRVGEGKTYLGTQPEFAARHITYLPGRTVLSVDPALHAVHLDDGTEVGYGKLLIATGGRVRALQVPGIENVDVRYFQTLDDARVLRDLPGMGNPAGSGAPAVVIGGGFIAVELAMAFVERGMPTSVVLRGDGMFGNLLGPAGRDRVEAVMAAKGVRIIKHAEVREVVGGPHAQALVLSNGEQLPFAELGVGIGLELNVEFLAQSGITLSRGVLVDERLHSSMPDVYAAGDVAEMVDARVGQRRIVGNWQNAMFQGRVAGDLMAGGEGVFDAVTTYSITCFGLPITFVGAVEVTGDGITRESRQSGEAFLQFVLKDGRVVSASCVGPFADRAKVVEMVKAGAPLI